MFLACLDWECNKNKMSLILLIINNKKVKTKFSTLILNFDTRFVKVYSEFFFQKSSLSTLIRNSYKYYNRLSKYFYEQL